MGACEAPPGLRVVKKARSPQILPPASEIKWVHPLALPHSQIFFLFNTCLFCEILLI